MKILGISAYYHDSAAALVIDGEVIAAAQEERFTRIKHDKRFPINAIKNILKISSLSLDDIDFIVFYEKPLLKFKRILATYINFSPRGFYSFYHAMSEWLFGGKLFQKRKILNGLRLIDSKINYTKKIIFSEHHLSHAASAFFPSPFDKALILTMDGVGEWATTSVSIGEGKSIRSLKEIHFPHSLGLLYTAFTYYAGFKVNSGEYKLMGLAPYGEPRYSNIILDKIIDIKPDGSFRLDMRYFNYCTGLTMISKSFERLFGRPRRKASDDIEQFHMDIAASIQKVVEIILIRISQSLVKETGIKKICLSGGVALNCVANGKLYHEKIFENIWIQPASGDAGGALGAALAAYYAFSTNKRTIKQCGSDSMKGAFLGPQFSGEVIKNELKKCRARFHLHDHDKIIDIAATLLANNKVLGWFQGRMEYGPRSLGSRSILANPCSSQMQRDLNLKIKYRESFRPFAPSILIEQVHKWFDYEFDSPYMLMVSDVHDDHCMKSTKPDAQGNLQLQYIKSDIPAVTHVNYSARIQTVDAEKNPVYYKLIESFFDKTSCPILVNTSFNVRGEPIVCTPTDAFRCFMGTEMDILVIENIILYKDEQDKSLVHDYKNNFDLD